MSAFDIHPEHLIDAVRGGRANAAQRAELEAHMRVCAVCAAEHRLTAAFTDETEGAVSKLDGLSTVALDQMTDRLAAEGRVFSVLTDRSWARAAWLPWAAAACLFFTGSAAAATLIAVWRADRETALIQTSVVASPMGAAVHRSVSREARPAAVAASVAAVAPDNVAIEPKAPVAAEPPQAGAIRTTARSSLDTRNASSAGELFERARAAHLSGDAKLAVKLYRLLERRYPSSREAHVSWVVLGRLYLEQLGDPRAALSYFDRYIEKNGPNQPEALIGRARCLRALGRTQDEVQTLRRLAERYPDSFYAGRARDVP